MPTEFPLAEQRRLVWSQVALTPENDGWDVEPIATSPASFLLPLSETMEFNLEQGMESAPAFMGDILPHNVVDMQYTADLTFPLSFEFVTLGRVCALYFGANGMSKPEGATGKIFDFFLPTTVGSKPKSTNATSKKLESTIQYERLGGIVPHSIKFPFMVAGMAKYSLGAMGSGSFYTTTHAGSAAVNDGFEPASYLNYTAIINDIVASGLTNFTIDSTQTATRTDVGSRQGRAGAILTGSHSANGEIGMMHSIDGSGIESNNNLTTLWQNKTIFPVECIYSDLPGDLATQFFRMRFYVRIGKPKTSVGGEAGDIQTANWQMVRGTAAQPTDWCAELIGDNKGPFTIPATSNFGIKIDNASTITVPITAGSRTLAQIVTELNAHVGFSAVAVARNLLGFLVIAAKSKGTTSKVQVDGTVLNSTHTLFGMATTAYFGRRTPLWWQLRNNFGAAY